MSPTDLFFVVTMALAFVVLAAILWMVRDSARERTRLFCPVRLRWARVVFGLAPTGARSEVVRCSIFGRRPITCGKVCLNCTAECAEA